MKERTILAILLIAFAITPSISQLNIKIGYTGAYLNSEVNNQIFQRYNEEREWLESEFGNLHMMHGIQLGLRYQLGNAALEFSWERTSSDRKALGEHPTEGFVEKELFYGINNFAIGLQNNFGLFGYGVTLERSRLKVQTLINSTTEKSELINQNVLSSRFYISFNIESGDFISLSIQPFVRIPWESYNLHPLELELRPNSILPESDFDEKWTTFGLSIVFYNGQQ